MAKGISSPLRPLRLERPQGVGVRMKKALNALSLAEPQSTQSTQTPTPKALRVYLIGSPIPNQVKKI